MENQDRAIKCHAQEGPCFGDGSLAVLLQGNGVCKSSVGDDTFEDLTNDEGLSVLTGVVGRFTAVEVEVFRVSS